MFYFLPGSRLSQETRFRWTARSLKAPPRVTNPSSLVNPCPSRSRKARPWLVDPSTKTARYWSRQPTWARIAPSLRSSSSWRRLRHQRPPYSSLQIRSRGISCRWCARYQRSPWSHGSLLATRISHSFILIMRWGLQYFIPYMLERWCLMSSTLI